MIPRLALILIRFVLASFADIIASDADIMLERVFVAVYHGCHVCKYRLDLRLLVFVKSWGTQEFQSGCIVLVDV